VGGWLATVCPPTVERDRRACWPAIRLSHSLTRIGLVVQRWSWSALC